VQEIPRSPQALLETFATFASCDIADAGGLPLPPGLAAVHPVESLCGFARTVQLAPGDNLGLQALAVQAKPGDVLVAVGGGEEAALVGELLSLRASVRGAQGFLLDGYARDEAALALPVFARGLQPRRPARRDFVALDQPVRLLGVPIRPGDLVRADADGIVVVPRESLEDVLRQVAGVLAANAATRARILAGEDLGWLERDLARRGQAD